MILGPRVGMSGTVICAGKSIEIGEGTILGAGAMVVDNDFHAPEGQWDWSDSADVPGETAKPVKIGRGVFIGARAMVLKGVTINNDKAIVTVQFTGVSKDISLEKVNGDWKISTGPTG